MKLFFGTVFPETTIDADEQQHIIKVLRMRNGEEISVTDGKGNLAKGTLVLEGKKANIEVSAIEKALPDFSPKLHIAIAPTKNIDRTEFFIEKATELGISEITFLQTEKSERKIINPEKIKKQIISASKQSLRVHFPVIHPMVKLQDFISTIDPETTYIAHCDPSFERTNLNALKPRDHITFLIGPEGDFSPNEVKLLTEKGIKSVTLGNQRLRTETAGVFIAAWNYYKMMNLISAE